MATKFISDLGPKSALIAPRPFYHNVILIRNLRKFENVILYADVNVDKYVRGSILVER